MAKRTKTLSEKELRTRFAISPLLDTEIDISGLGWVGLTADASHSLRQSVTAAVIAERMGYSSIDYVKKRYLSNIEEHISRDEPLRTLYRFHEFSYNEFYHSFEPRTDAPIGVFAFDLAMVRARTALELLVSVARQGFMIEAALVARSLVEQFSYAAYVWDKTEDAEVFDVHPQNLLRNLKDICPSSGRAYGLLSKMAHYNPREHYHFIGDTEGATVNQRSWKFKIISSAWAFFIFDLNYLVFERFYGEYDTFAIVQRLRGSALKAFDRHFAGVSASEVEEVRSLFGESRRKV
ncbi:hypothetical protein FG91_03934 [Sphingopyxis sp. LC81]|uniref:hypothetical protein n=1 Tax=Sphingopyxis sp. LC81 TaxID=1502850 RepID=UPI00050E435B|nr:hypothetical protein [Sphingopyxis sp. LC81]KGB51886.1 hypothetical protein FG91_03934 [Sphingopyxis sp. LC81]